MRDLETYAVFLIFYLFLDGAKSSFLFRARNCVMAEVRLLVRVEKERSTAAERGWISPAPPPAGAAASIANFSR